MIFYPISIEMRSGDTNNNEYKVIKGNWTLTDKKLETQIKSSLNHGGKEEFSYIISHIIVNHDFFVALQKSFSQ